MNEKLVFKLIFDVKIQNYFIEIVSFFEQVKIPEGWYPAEGDFGYFKLSKPPFL